MSAPTATETLRDMIDVMLEIQRSNCQSEEKIVRVAEIIHKSSELIANSETTTEIALDSEIFQAGSEIFKSDVTVVETNLERYSEEEYIKGIMKYVENNISESESEKLWERLAPVTYHLYSKSTPVTYMVGSLELTPAQPKEKLKVERQRKVVSDKTNLTSSTDSKGKQRNDIEENICGHILRTLRKCYKENVRDGYVNLYLNDQNLPVVVPINKSNEDAAENMKQFCFSLSKKDWQDCIQKFEISSAKIKPFEVTS